MSNCPFSLILPLKLGKIRDFKIGYMNEYYLNLKLEDQCEMFWQQNMVLRLQ